MVEPLPLDRHWTLRQAATYLGVSERCASEFDLPRVELPGHGKLGKPIVRYAPEEVIVWAARWRTSRRDTTMRRTG